MSNSAPAPRGASIGESILARARTTGTRAAVITPFGSLSGAQLADTAERIADLLQRRYAADALPILIVMGGDPWTVAALLAADLVGRPAVLLPASATSEELERAILACRVGLVLQSEEPAARLHPALARAHAAHHLLWARLPLGNRMKRDGRERPAVHGFVVHRTSGTSGASKFALRSRSAVRVEIESVRGALNLTEDDVVLCGSAVSHSYGCVGGLLAPLESGACVIIAPIATGTYASQIDAQPSIVFGLGPAYAAMLESSAGTTFGTRNVRFAFSAGAPLPPGLFEQFLARIALPIRQDYGTSETGTISLDLAGDPRPRTVGRILPHVQVQVRPSAAFPLEEGESGEIQIQSPALADGYLEEGRLISCVNSLGWYGTRDAGSWDGGSLRVHRRLRLPAHIHGEQVILDRVERALGAMPGIDEVVVSPGRPEAAPELVAFVATRTLTVQEVEAWCAQNLPVNWIPSRIVVLESLPRTPAGKLIHKYD